MAGTKMTVNTITKTKYELYSVYLSSIVLLLFTSKIEQNIVTIVFNQFFQLTRYQYMGTLT